MAFDTQGHCRPALLQSTLAGLDVPMILEAIALYMSDASSTKPLKSLGTPRRPKVLHSLQPHSQVISKLLLLRDSFKTSNRRFKQEVRIWARSRYFGLTEAASRTGDSLYLLAARSLKQKANSFGHTCDRRPESRAAIAAAQPKQGQLLLHAFPTDFLWESRIVAGQTSQQQP